MVKIKKNYKLKLIDYDGFYYGSRDSGNSYPRDL
jgi:hypothetical protein